MIGTYSIYSNYPYVPPSPREKIIVVPKSEKYRYKRPNWIDRKGYLGYALINGIYYIPEEYLIFCIKKEDGIHPIPGFAFVMDAPRKKSKAQIPSKRKFEIPK